MHGGDIYRNHVSLDFSVNINPNDLPNSVINAMQEGMGKFQCYPDPLCRKLKDKISKCLDVKTDWILCGNGASELLMSLCHAISPRKALLLAPGFSGYAYALEAVSCSISYVYTKEEEGFALQEEVLEEIRRHRPDLMMFSNPSNPIGVMREREFIRKILEVCRECSTIIVVDECFMELTDAPEKNSIIPYLKEYPHLIVLRAFTKSFSIPGIRLGYMLCTNAGLTKKIEKQLPEWNVSVMAQEVGYACLSEKEYLRQSRKMIGTERDFLSGELKKRGLKVYESKTNFILFICRGVDLYEELLKAGILIRDCANYLGLGRGYYRIAVKKHEDNIRLLEALDEILNGCVKK